MKMISCQKFLPHPCLANHIKFFFLFETSEDQKGLYQRITPDCCVELNFNLGGAISRKESNGKAVVQRDLYVISRVSHHYYICSTSRIGMIGVRFFPWGIRPFIPFAAWEIADRLLTHQDIFGRKARELEEKVRSANNPAHAVDIIQRFCLELYDERKRDLIVEDAARRILASHGVIDVYSLEDVYDLSIRRIEQRFAENVGTSPKHLARLARFLQALYLIDQPARDRDLLDIVHKCGYFDQSHFNHDFKSFTGSTPTKYLAEKLSQNGFCT